VPPPSSARTARITEDVTDGEYDFEPGPTRRESCQYSWASQILCCLFVVGILVWQAITTSGNPNPLAPYTDGSAAILDIGVLVFREGLECVLLPEFPGTSYAEAALAEAN
jgi:hypothetical protein